MQSKSPTPDENEQKIAELDKQIQNALIEAERFGEEGRVDEAQKLMKQVESFKAQQSIIRQVKDKQQQ